MNGVIYMTWGSRAIKQADQSMRSLWEVAPGMPVFVVGDAEAGDHYRSKDKIEFAKIDINPFARDQRFMAGLIKPLLAGMSPFDRSLYIDADSAFQRSPQVGFDLLDKWDFVVAETKTRSLMDTIAGHEEARWTREWLGTAQPLYHNSGMLFWRKNERTNKLFHLWSEEWKRFSDWDEQIALLRALLRSDAVYLNVPYEWNCHERSDSFMLFHWFGSRTAWKHPTARMSRNRTRGRVSTGVQPTRVTVEVTRVEIAPNVFVRCKVGDEAAVKERMTRIGKRALRK